MTVETPEVEMSDEEAEKMRHIIDSDDATERVRAAARRELRKAGRLDDADSDGDVVEHLEDGGGVEVYYSDGGGGHLF